MFLTYNGKRITFKGKAFKNIEIPIDPFFYPFVFNTIPSPTISHRSLGWHGNVFTSTTDFEWYSFRLNASHVGSVRLYLYDFAAEFTKTGDNFDGQLPYLGTQLRDQWIDVVVGDNIIDFNFQGTGTVENPKHYWIGLRTINVGSLANDGILRTIGLEELPLTPVNGIQLRDARSGNSNFDYFSQSGTHNFYFFYDAKFKLI